MVIQVKYVSPDETVTDGPRYGIGGLSKDASAPRRNQRTAE